MGSGLLAVVAGAIVDFDKDVGVVVKALDVFERNGSFGRHFGRSCCLRLG